MSICRTAAPTSEEDAVQVVMKRVDVDDVNAMDQLGRWYQTGESGLPQNEDKALELWHRAGELGHAASHKIGNSYLYGMGVERDEMKATHYWELAAMGGDEMARHNLGVYESNMGNFGRAIKHYMIAVGFGYNVSLNEIYLDGRATKVDYAKALKAYQAYLSEIKSDDRDKAAEFNDNCKYYL